MQIFKTSVARKVAMALSAFFLIIFLVIHLAVNFMSVLSPSTFNMLSHFMGTNPLIQFAMQPVLLVGVIFHFVMGFVLELQNKRARGSQPYYSYKGSCSRIFSPTLIWLLGTWDELQVYRGAPSRRNPLLWGACRKIPQPYTCRYLCTLLCILMLTLTSRLSICFPIRRLKRWQTQETHQLLR